LCKDNCLLEARRVKGKYSVPNNIRLIAGSAFWHCDSLISITLHKGITNINNSTFSGCENLVSINIPNTVTSIGESAFRGCKRLESIIIPEGVTTIGIHTFWYCESLLTIIIPESVTTIGYGAFSGCRKLKSITIPKNVNYIGNFAFNYYDSNLSTIICLPTEPPILEGNDVFTRSNSTTLQVPRGSLERYKASDWNKYFSRIEEIDD
jgi:hypothetical protein